MRFGIKQPGPHLRLHHLLAGWPESACKARDPGSIPGWERSPGERDQLPTPVFMSFHGGSDGKESACSAGDLDSIARLGRSPGEEHGKSFQYSCLENFHGQRCLAGYSPWGCLESDTTERLHFHFSLSCLGEGNGNPLQCSCLENPRDGGAWWAAVCEVEQSRTQLKRLNSSSSSSSRRRSFPWPGLALASPSTRVDRERYGHTWL